MDQKLLEDGFIRAMRKEMRKERLEEAKRKRTSFSMSATVEDEKPSKI